MHNCRFLVGQKSQKLQKEGFLNQCHRDTWKQYKYRNLATVQESSYPEHLADLNLLKSQTSLEMGDFDLHMEHHSGYHFKIY